MSIGDANTLEEQYGDGESCSSCASSGAQDGNCGSCGGDQCYCPDLVKRDEVCAIVEPKLEQIRADQEEFFEEIRQNVIVKGCTEIELEDCDNEVIDSTVDPVDENNLKIGKKIETVISGEVIDKISDSVGEYERVDQWIVYSDSEGIDLGLGAQLCLERTVTNETCRPMWINYDFSWSAGVESQNETPGGAIGIEAFVDGVAVLEQSNGSQSANQIWSQLDNNFIEFAGQPVNYGKYVAGGASTTFRVCLTAGSYWDTSTGIEAPYDVNDLYAKAMQLRINGSN